MTQRDPRMDTRDPASAAVEDDHPAGNPCTVVFVRHDGSEEFRVAVDAGCSLMEAAVGANVPGILAECGGQLDCGSCHVHVATEWLDRVGEASGLEAEIIGVLDDMRPSSRLSCQVRVSEDLDGLVVRLVGD